MKIKLSWPEFRDRVNLKSLALQFIDRSDHYYLWVEDGGVLLEAEIYISSPINAEQAEFESLYKPFANEPAQLLVWDEHNPEVQGFYECQGDQYLDIPASVGWHEFDYSWPFPIAIYNGTFEVNPEHVGDEIAVDAMPKKIVGALTADCAVSDKTFSVSPTALGFFMGHKYFVGHLIEGANVSELGRCLSVDPTLSQVTFENGASFAHAAASPTYIAMTARFILGWHMSREGTFRVADNMQGGSLLPANEILRLKYKNNDGVAKKLYWKMEYRM